ncbi:hypothetical protein LTR39_006339, partial [Cryomyces antarcticus]
MKSETSQSTEAALSVGGNGRPSGKQGGDTLNDHINQVLVDNDPGNPDETVNKVKKLGLEQ